MRDLTPLGEGWGEGVHGKQVDQKEARMNYPVIFIDANIYLTFYKGADPSLKKLLKRLLAVKQLVFCPQQIVREVNRNKLNLVKNLFSEQKKNLKISQQNLVGHFPIEQNEEWHVLFRTSKMNVESILKSFEKKSVSVLQDVSRSEDFVSRELENIFKNAIPENKVQIGEAEHRKNLGQPPGKKTDPIGDELCWIQFLDYIEKNEKNEFWIVTQDQDYFTKYNKDLFLNPLLHAEIKQISGVTEIRIFEKLSAALSAFESEHPDFTELVFTEEEKEEMSKAEELVIAGFLGVLGFAFARFLKEKMREQRKPERIIQERNLYVHGFEDAILENLEEE